MTAESRLDQAILQVLREAAPIGALPTKIAYQLRAYGVDRFEVTRRIKAMNRRLDNELGYDAAEKIGHGWALRDSMADVWAVKERTFER